MAGKTKQWVTYLDTRKDQVGAIEDDHIGVTNMIMHKPDFHLLGYVACRNIENAINYAEQVFMDGKNIRKPLKRGEVW